MKSTIDSILLEHKKILQAISNCQVLKSRIDEASDAIIEAFQKNGKVLIFGCGGSAADAQHFAAEFVNKFELEREALPAIALTTDTSAITAIGNDSYFNDIFSRQVEALADSSDVVFGISTSGMSHAVLRGLYVAKTKKSSKTVLLEGGVEKPSHQGYIDIDIVVPSFETPRIQEMHIMILHIIASLVEEAYAKKESD